MEPNIQNIFHMTDPVPMGGESVQFLGFGSSLIVAVLEGDDELAERMTWCLSPRLN